MKRWIALCALLLISGCFGNGNGGPPDVGESSNTQSSSEPRPSELCPGGRTPPCASPDINGTITRRLELLECQTFWMFYPADAEKLQALMPPGYTFAQGALPTVGLDAFICSSVVIDNSTVVRDFQWYAVSGAAGVPDEVKSPDGIDLYHWETCMNLPEVQQIFRSAGFKVCDGAVEAVIVEKALALKFYQAGVLTYDYQGAGQAGNGSVYFPESLRFHHYNGENATWFDEKTDPYSPSLGEAGPILVYGGLISQVMLPPGDATVAHSGIGRGRFNIEFPAIENPLVNQ